MYSEEEKTSILLMKFVKTLALKPTTHREKKMHVLETVHY